MVFESGTSIATATTKRDDTTPSTLMGSAEKLPIANTTVAPASEDGPSLPVPVVQGSLSSGRHARQVKKTARISGGLRVHWDRLKRKIGTGTAPSDSEPFEESVGEGSHYFRSRGGAFADGEDERVDEVVVDREWSDEFKSYSGTHSDHGGTPEKSGGSNHMGGTNADMDSLAVHVEGIWTFAPLTFLRWRLWPSAYGFFVTHFIDEKSESHYNKENWFLRKVCIAYLTSLNCIFIYLLLSQNLALWSACFFILNWVLAVAFIPKPVVVPDEVFYYAVGIPQPHTQFVQ